MWFGYILYSGTLDKFYTGVTTDVQRRLLEHNTSKKGAKFTKAGRPWHLVYTLPMPEGQSQALRWEARTKRYSHAEKLALVQTNVT